MKSQFYRSRYGRRNVSRFSCILYLITASAISFAPNFPLVLLLRFIVGIPGFMTYLSGLCLGEILIIK